MKRFDPRIFIGILLILGGGVALIEKMGYLQNATDWFWGIAFFLGGLGFLSLLLEHENWWAAFPGFILLSIGFLIIMPEVLKAFEGAIFLGMLAFSFWYVYLSNRDIRWWAIIPAGVLTALAMLIAASSFFADYSSVIVLGAIGLIFLIVYFTDVTDRWWALIPSGVLFTLTGMTFATEYFGEFQTAGFFFLGLSLTFLMVALLAKMKWAYWPALALGVMGFLGLGSLLNITNYLWAVALMLLGVYLIARYFSTRSM